MIRFKVIRASRLLLAVAILALVAALALLGVKLLNRHPTPTVSGSASLVEATTEDRVTSISEATTESDEARTAVFASSGHSGAFSLDPRSQSIEVEVVPTPTEAPRQRVLIYHTHTHEAYEQVVEDPYEALEAWRTSDIDHSVVRVGEELAENLRRYGFEVVHDTTDHEAEQLSTAYTRSLATLQRYETPFDLYIDLHRDAYVEGEPMTVTAESGAELAPLMMLIGNGVGFDVKPWYEQNYAFAQALEARINAIEPGLCKPVLVKDGRYNQHIGVFAVLIEVGHNLNTLHQALSSIPPLAAAIDDLLAENPSPELQRMKSDWEASHSN